MLPFKTPKLLKLLKPSLEWEVEKTGEPTIYLTFDDGPIPAVTEFVIDTLARYDAKATFFCIGENIKKHPGIFEKVLKAGHSIGNHTYNHLKGSETKTSEYLDNIAACDVILKQEMGNITPLFRPPFGRLKESQRKAVLKEKRIIMWDVLSQDYRLSVDKETCNNKVLKHTGDGSIVIFHDSLKAQEKMEYALTRMIAHFSKLGYVFKAIPN
jgi:peptidoglycan/xylan/chitin deacetylase (PgdA/CDA1 family)